MNLRAAVRYVLQAQVVFQWNDEEGSAKVARGHTRNISQKGAYVVAGEFPPSGARVAMSIFLPALRGDSRTLRMDAQGLVMRVEHAEKAEGAPGFGFAVANCEVTLSGN